VDATFLPHSRPQTGFDIFCRVIDNYGDIGVCWRLARQLAQRSSDSRVRLWVDDLASFACIEPAIQANPTTVQKAQGVEVYSWEQSEQANLLPLDVVIEAFACELPVGYRSKLKAEQQHWINLEYLSAEAWVEDCHGLPSPQANGVAKYFFFPGFTPRTGGLLREPSLLAQRDAWRSDPNGRTALLQGLGVPAAWIAGVRDQGWQQCYAFCYPHAPLQSIVDAYQAQARPTLILAAPGAPATRQAGNQVVRFDCPYVDQQAFDRLLWSSDLNLIRGEDSFVRAIWAAQPFLWHIYPQQEQIHLEKLHAWLALQPCTPEATELMLSWNRGEAKAVNSQLQALLQAPQWQNWQASATRFSEEQAGQHDLVMQLLQLVQRSQ